MRRILSNYARMILNFALGVWLVRILLGIDEGVYAVVILLGTTVGISGMLREVVRAAMIAELGLALHGGRKDEFETVYASSFVLSAIAAVGTILVLFGFYLAFSAFDIPGPLQTAAAIFLACRAAAAFVAVLFAPTTNLLPITGRMAEMNFWLLMERVAEVGAALAVALLMSGRGAAAQLVGFALSSSILLVLVDAGWILSPMLRDRRFRPQLSKADRGSIRTIWKTIGWNGFVVAAMNLYTPFMTLVMNLVFGVGATVVFGVAVQLLAYIRQSVMGVAFGIDAVFTRLASDNPSYRNALTDRVTGLQGAVVLGLCSWASLNIDPILRIWLGDRLSDPATQIPAAALTFNLLMAGIVARSVTEGWMKYLTGVGRVQAYGPLLLKGAAFNPPLIVAATTLAPESFSQFAPSVVFSILLVAVHLGFLPRVMARETGRATSQVLKPLVAPVALTALSTALALVLVAVIDVAPIVRLATTAAATGLVFAPYLVANLMKLDET